MESIMIKDRKAVQLRYVETIVDHMTTEQLAEYAMYMMMCEMDNMTDEELLEEIQMTNETQVLEDAV
jgi:hypothetical protein